MCRHFGPELGYHNAHELGWAAVADGDAKQPARTLRGSPLFDEELFYDELERRVDKGWKFETTPISLEFTLEDVVATKPQNACWIAALDSDGGVFFHPWNDRIDDEHIHTVIMLVPPRAL